MCPERTIFNGLDPWRNRYGNPIDAGCGTACMASSFAVGARCGPGAAAIAEAAGAAGVLVGVGALIGAAIALPIGLLHGEAVRETDALEWQRARPRTAPRVIPKVDVIPVPPLIDWVEQYCKRLRDRCLSLPPPPISFSCWECYRFCKNSGGLWPYHKCTSMKPWRDF